MHDINQYLKLKLQKTNKSFAKAGYATNSKYASKLINIINTYDLKLDKRKKL